MTAVNITRPAGGISLNAGIREFLLDKPDGEKMEFQSRGVAIAFLMNTFNYTYDDIQEMGIEFPEVEDEP